MLKIYDTNHNFLGLLDKDLKNVYTTDMLDMGWRTLHFELPCIPEYLQYLSEENYVETEDYNYIIKEIKSEDNNYLSVDCAPNLDDFKNNIIETLDLNLKGLQQIYQQITQYVGWTLIYESLQQTMLDATYSGPNKYIIDDVIKVLASAYSQEIWFDTKNKKIYIYDTMGQDRGVLYSNELNLKLLKRYSNSYDFATVIQPLPSRYVDAATIEFINNGQKYLTNYTYSNKSIVKMYQDKNAKHGEEILAGAQKLLNEVSIPKITYELLLSGMNENVGIGDTITVIDKIKNIKIKQRVVKIIRYPFEPEKSNITISNLPADFYKKYITGIRETNEFREDADDKYWGYKNRFNIQRTDMENIISVLSTDPVWETKFQEHPLSNMTNTNNLYPI